MTEGDPKAINEEMLQCAECREFYGMSFFSPVGFRKNTFEKYRERRCKLCRLSARTDAKTGAGRFLVKARNAFSSHAPKFLRKGIIQTREELKEVYGWDIPIMAHDIEHAFANNCPACNKPFKKMANGLQEVSIDITDPNRPPHYGLNTRWICQTCNKKKAKTPYEQYAREAQWRRKWERRRKELENNPWAGTPLFGSK